MNELTQEDIKNILALIAVAPIKGELAFTVAQLQAKLNNKLTPEIKTTSEVTGTDEKKPE